jgi:hypothetical protein
MKQTDQDIDRLLAGLNDTEPPEGMQHRILHHTRHHAPQPHPWRTLLTPRLEAHPWAIALSCATILASVIYWTALRPHSAHEITASKHLAPTNQQPMQAQKETTTFTPPSGHPSIAFPRKKTKPATAKLTTDSASNSLDQLAAQNHPAPELPLTEDEKLLLRLVHRYDPVEVAALNRDPMPAHDAEEKEEFKKFFEPHTTGDHQ